MAFAATASLSLVDQIAKGFDEAVAELRQPFVILDFAERLILWNQAYGEMHCDQEGTCVLYPGMPVATLTAWRLASGFFHTPDGETADLDPRDYRPGEDRGAQVYQLADDRWMLAERYRLANGLNVGLWIDITTLKRTEEALRETAARLAARDAELSRAQIELEEINANLEQRVRARTGELLATQDELLKKERMAAIGHLTATVAHELRNPMSAIRNTVFALKEYGIKNPADLTRPLERIGRSVDRCDRIIEELLDYSRSRPLQTEIMTFDAWLHDILAELGTPAGVGVALKPGADAARVALDIDRMRRVIVNLVENAAQAMAEPGAERKSALAPHIALRTQMIDDATLELQIEDNGPGIAPENLAKVFEPLFTTKRQGTGLGLPTVKQIIQQHDGEIELHSALGEFTRATIRLPLAASRRASA